MIDRPVRNGSSSPASLVCEAGLPISPSVPPIVQTCRALFRDGDVFEVRLFGALPRGDTPVAGFYDLAHLDSLVQGLARYEPRARSVYVTLNSVDPALHSRIHNRLQEYAKNLTRDINIRRRRWLPIDCDPTRPAEISSSEEEHRAALDKARDIRRYLIGEGWPMEAILCADSGNGGHLLAAIDLPSDAASEALVKGCLEALAARFDDERVTVDVKVFNAARVFKLYGTWARKGDNTEERPHRLSRLLYAPAALELISTELLTRLAAQAPTRPAPQSRPAVASGAADRSSSGPFDMEAFLARHHLTVDSPLPYRGGQKWQIDCPFNPDHKAPDAALYVTSTGAAGFTCSHSSCAGKNWYTLRDLLEPGWREAKGWAEEAAGGRRKPSGKRQTRKVAQARGVAPAELDQDNLSDLDTIDDLPIIETNGRQMRDISADATAALIAANDPPMVYARGRSLVRVAEDRRRRCVVAPYDNAALRGRLARVANWVRTEESGTVSCPPPAFVVEDVPTIDGVVHAFPALDGIVAAPVVSPSGTLQLQRGYLADAAVFHHPTDPRPLPAIDPTPENVAAAKELLLDNLLVNFPFVDQASRAHALAMLLLPFLRPYIDGPTPLHLVDAPTQGTGKSLLVEMALYLALGTAPSATYCPTRRDDEEWRKKLTAVLEPGPSYVWFDNLKFRLDSGALALALTAPEWTDRILGESRTVTVPIRATWVLTGNNIELDGDFPRRSLWIRLDTQEERPEDRDPTLFKVKKLRVWVKEEWPRLVAAVMTLLSLWIAEGRPSWAGKTFGSYEEWCLTIGGVLDVIKVPGFLENREDLYERSDPERDKWAAFVKAWWDAHGSNHIGVSELIDIAVEYEVVGDNQRGGKVSLGTQLRAQRDKIYSRLRISQGKTKQRIAHYYLDPMKQQTLALGDSAPQSSPPPTGSVYLGVSGVSSPPRARTQVQSSSSDSSETPPESDAQEYAHTRARGPEIHRDTQNTPGDNDDLGDGLSDPFADEEEDPFAESSDEDAPEGGAGDFGETDDDLEEDRERWQI